MKAGVDLTKPSRTLVIALLVASLPASGCRIFLGGSLVEEQATTPVRVTTQPQGAWVWKQDSAGRQTLGRSPLTYNKRYKRKVFRSMRWWEWTIGLSMMVVGGVMMGAGIASIDSESDSSGPVVLMAVGVLPATMGFLSAIAGLVGVAIDGKTFPDGSQNLTIGARMDGYGQSTVNLKVPDKTSASLVLLPSEKATVGLAASPGPAPAAAPATPRKKATIVAVFGVQDPSGKFDKKTMAQLTEYLETMVTQETGWRVVPREQLRQRLVQQKKGSYRACVDQACQIELGKAVAAQKSLSTKLLQVGSKCALTAKLYDLKSETAEKAATARTDCSDDALMGAVDVIVKGLTR